LVQTDHPGAWGPTCWLPWVDKWYRENLPRHRGPQDGDRFNYTVPQTLGPVDWTNQAAWTLMFSAIATAKQRLRDEIGKYPTEPVEISEWPLASAPVHKYLDRLRHKEAERDGVIAARGWRSGRGSGDEDGAGKRVARFAHMLETPKRLSNADAKADQALIGLGDGAETAESEGHRPGRRHVPARRADRKFGVPAACANTCPGDLFQDMLWQRSVVRSNGIDRVFVVSPP
jgi:hypothetical protein